MTPLRSRMIDKMRLRNFAPRTQESYVGAVAGLAKFFQASPDRLTSDQVQAYLLDRIDRGLAWSSINVAACGIRFFYRHVMGRRDVDWLIPPRKTPSPLPEIFSVEEVERLVLSPENIKHRVLLMLAYTAGLRVSELSRLRVDDIDSGRMMVRVVNGKGKKDRYTLLSDRVLTELRLYWCQQLRSRSWLFPGNIPGRPICSSTASRIYDKAKRACGLTKGAGIHTLRHCFATHLLEAGVDLRTIQELMGHNSILTTMRYLRVTRKRVGEMARALDLLRVPTEAPGEAPLST
jgi:integrase/recombinase XerD